jgi:hypothetical protein
MNPAYRTTRFRCAIPATAVPVRFLILTACNPGDQVWTPSENRHADRLLADFLDSQGPGRFRVVGGCPDFLHQEPGWGFPLPDLTPGIGMARRFDQAAVYWVETDVLWLVDCRNGDREALGSWASRTDFVPVDPVSGCFQDR